MSTRYGKKLLEDVQYREECREKVGLGFNLPTPKPVLFGLHGLQNEENVVAASRHLTPICRRKCLGGRI